MALGKFIHQKNKSEIEKTKIRINQPGSRTPPKLSAMGTNCWFFRTCRVKSKKKQTIIAEQ
jgi:hypothetical protein